MQTQTKRTKRPSFKTYPFTVDEARALWLSDLPNKEIAEKLNITFATFQAFARVNKFPRRPVDAQRFRGRVRAEPVDPTPEEILALAAELREKRTEQEKERLYGYRHVEIRHYSYNGRDHVFAEM